MPLACVSGVVSRSAGFFLCLVFALSGSSAASTAARAEGLSGSPISSTLLPIRNRHQVPGMAVAIVTGDGLRSIGVVGVRKHGTSDLISTNDLWHLGSDTKAMTATLVARLVERGLLRWDMTLPEVFPELAGSFESDYTNVTVIHLLSHRAGLVGNLDWAKLSRSGTVQEQRLRATKQALSQKPRSKPGTAYFYSNLGYVVAGATVERVTGKSWEQEMRQELFAPLGMQSAGFGGLGTPGLLDQPWGHTKPNKPVRANGPDMDNPPVMGPAGRVHCTLSDWALFIADQLRGLNGQPGLLQPASYQMLAKAPFNGEYGLGWGIAERSWAGGLALNHCGCNTMFYANAWLAPKRNFAILVCANLGLQAFDATDEAVAALLPEAIALGQQGRNGN